MLLRANVTQTAILFSGFKIIEYFLDLHLFSGCDLWKVTSPCLFKRVSFVISERLGLHVHIYTEERSFEIIFIEFNFKKYHILSGKYIFNLFILFYRFHWESFFSVFCAVLFK